MIWKEGPQRRIHPLNNKPDRALANASKLASRTDALRPHGHESKLKVGLQSSGFF